MTASGSNPVAATRSRVEMLPLSGIRWYTVQSRSSSRTPILFSGRTDILIHAPPAPFRPGGPLPGRFSGRKGARGRVKRRMADYMDLADIAERLFEASDDDDERLAGRLDTLDEETRRALLASDLLNAYQVFYFWFRETPDDLAMERLQLHAASDLARGIVIDEIDIYDLVFSVKGGNPVLVLTDGENTLARFEGERAYGEILEYLDEHP